jgi:hypothetical protein
MLDAPAEDTIAGLHDRVGRLQVGFRDDEIAASSDIAFNLCGRAGTAPWVMLFEMLLRVIDDGLTY